MSAPPFNSSSGSLTELSITNRLSEAFSFSSPILPSAKRPSREPRAAHFHLKQPLQDRAAVTPRSSNQQSIWRLGEPLFASRRCEYMVLGLTPSRYISGARRPTVYPRHEPFVHRTTPRNRKTVKSGVRGPHGLFPQAPGRQREGAIRDPLQPLAVYASSCIREHLLRTTTFPLESRPAR
jgi:hypothetical protein